MSNVLRAARARHGQKSRLYAAERCLFIARPAPAAALADVAACQAYVDRVLGSRWYRGAFRYGPDRVLVTDGRGARRALAYGWRRIGLPRWARQPAVILHELAHCTVAAGSAAGAIPRRHAAHGPEFVAVYLRLVGRWMGDEAARTLRASIVAHRVRHRPDARA